VNTVLATSMVELT